MIKIITRENSKLHGDVGSRETRRYQVIKEYPRYYLCECIYNGKSVYRECFLKVEIHRIKEVPVVREKYEGTGWYL